MITYKSVIRRAEKLKEGYYKPVKGLGWATAPLAIGKYSSDKHGFRVTSTEIHKLPSISFWGDSLVHGDEVGDSKSWLWLLQRRFKRWVVNGGVSAYGCDQAYLRFKMMQNVVRSDTAFLSYATTNLVRHLNMERGFLSPNTSFLLLKPRFAGGEVIYPPYTTFHNLAAVLRRKDTQRFLKKYDYFYPSFLRQLTDKFDRQKALSVTFEIFKAFMGFCRKNKIRGTILMLPMYTGINKSGEDFDELIWRMKDIPYLDLRPFLNERHFARRNHYNEEGSRIVAGAVAEYIKGL